MNEPEAPPPRPDSYADLLGAAPDPALRRLVVDLDAMYSAPTPPPQLLRPPAWDQAAASTGRHAPAGSRRLFGGRGQAPEPAVPALRRGWFAMAASVVLLLTGVLAVSLIAGGGAGHPGGPTPTPTPDEFARLALDHVAQAGMVESGTPQVLLSRRVVAADLPCLGLGTISGLPDDEPLALVILKGVFSIRDIPMPIASVPDDVHYIAYVYIVRLRMITSERTSARGDGLQAVLHDPTLPELDAIRTGPRVAYQNPALAQILAGPGQPVNRSTSADGWTITVGRVYADSNRVIVTYQITRPHQSGSVDSLTLTDAQNNQLPVLGRGEDDTPDTPWEVAWFANTGVPAGPAPEPLRFTVSLLVAPPPPPPTPPSCSTPNVTPARPAPTVTTAPPPLMSGLGILMPFGGMSMLGNLVPTAAPAAAPQASSSLVTIAIDFTVVVAAATPLPTLPPPVPTQPGGYPQPVPSAFVPLTTPTPVPYDGHDGK